jgi:hypothetical protein
MAGQQLVIDDGGADEGRHTARVRMVLMASSSVLVYGMMGDLWEGERSCCETVGKG